MSRSDHIGGVLCGMLIGWLIGVATPEIWRQMIAAWAP